jgi:hypothetical protein
MLDDKAREYAARLVPLLGPMGACPRCVMRFVGVSGAEQYSRPQASAWTELCAAIGGEAPAIACPDVSMCCVCMGVLALIDDASAVEGLLEKLGTTTLRSPSFVLEVALPSSIFVRQRGAYLDASATIGREAMPRNDHIIEAKSVLKMQFTDAIARLLGAPRDDKAAHYHVTINVEHRLCDEESRAVVDGTAPSSERGPKRQRAGEASSSSVRSVLKALFEQDCRDRLLRAKLCPPGLASEPCEVTLTTFHDPICIGGRYNKYSRTMPQTPWWLDGEKHGVSSVQEEMQTALLAAYAARSSSFHGSGREDIDVRMLGSGRPFVLELMEPALLECGTEYGTLLPELEARINSSCQSVQVCPRALDAMHERGGTSEAKGGGEGRPAASARACAAAAVSRAVRLPPMVRPHAAPHAAGERPPGGAPEHDRGPRARGRG